MSQEKEEIRALQYRVGKLEEQLELAVKALEFSDKQIRDLQLHNGTRIPEIMERVSLLEDQMMARELPRS